MTLSEKPEPFVTEQRPEMFSKSPLLNRTLAGVLLPFLFLVGFTLYQASGLFSRLEEQVRSELAITLDHVAHDLAYHREITARMARLASGHDDIVTAFNENRNHQLFRWGKQIIDSKAVSRVSFINPSGVVLARGHDELRFNDPYRGPADLNRLRRGEDQTFLAQQNGGWFFVSAAPVFQYDVVFKGIVVVEKALTPAFFDAMAKGFGLERIALYFSENTPPPFGDKTKGFLSAAAVCSLENKNGNRAFTLVITKSVAKQMSRLQSLSRQTLALTLSMALAALALITLVIRHSLRSIRALHSHLDRFQCGSLSLSSVVDQMAPLKDQKDEIGLIAKSFARTLTQLQAYQNTLETQVKERTRALEHKARQLSEEMAEHKKTEQEYRLVVQNATEAIFILQEGRVHFPNPKTIELMGRELDDICTAPFALFIHPDHREKVVTRNQQILDGQTEPGMGSFQILHPHCERWVQLNTVFTLWGKKPATLNFMRDVTELRKTQQTLIQSEKMLSVGGLAAGMAHEINNPLAGMMQNAQVVINRLTLDLPGNRKAAEHSGISMTSLGQYLEHRKIIPALEHINEAGKKAAVIVKNMLSFSRKSSKETSGHDLRTILDSALALAYNDFDLKQHYDFKTIRIKTRYAPTLLPARCQESKIQQVFFNILKNAAQALMEQGDRDDSRITLRAFQEGSFICAQIEDNGPGMDPATRKRVFEPFFTTKPVDRGTGLGLSIAYFIIVEDHGGHLSVQSEEGRGTCFTIRLPAVR